MGTKRQKNQLELAFLDDPRGEAPRVCEEGTEVSMARQDDERPAGTEDLTLSSASCSTSLNRRVRTRTHGGVTGKAREGLPMSISSSSMIEV